MSFHRGRKKTHAFDCGNGQSVLTRRISVGLTITVHNLLRVKVSQASCRTAQLYREE